MDNKITLIINITIDIIGIITKTPDELKIFKLLVFYYTNRDKKKKNEYVNNYYN